MRALALAPLRFYKRFLSPLLPPMCRFEPTCSIYMMQAIEKHGTLRGVWLGFRGVFRLPPCHPGGGGPLRSVREVGPPSLEMENRIFAAVLISIGFLWLWAAVAPKRFPDLMKKPVPAKVETTSTTAAPSQPAPVTTSTTSAPAAVEAPSTAPVVAPIAAAAQTITKIE